MCSAVKDQQLHPCDSLLLELNVIWDEVGEPDTVRDKTLLELEQECLDVYRRKVDQANRCRAQLRRSIAEAEAELAGICSAIGKPPAHVRQGGSPLASERRRCSGQTHRSLRFSSGSNYSLEICSAGDQSMTPSASSRTRSRTPLKKYKILLINGSKHLKTQESMCI